VSDGRCRGHPCLHEEDTYPCLHEENTHPCLRAADDLCPGSVRAATLSCHLNAAMCHLKLGNAEPCRDECNKVSQQPAPPRPALPPGPTACAMITVDESRVVLRCEMGPSVADRAPPARQALELDSGNPKARFRRGCAYMQLGNMDAAEADFKAALAASPDDAAVKKELAKARCPPGSVN